MLMTTTSTLSMKGSVETSYSSSSRPVDAGEPLKEFRKIERVKFKIKTH